LSENEPVRRRAAIDDIWNEDGVFYDPNGGIYRGRDEIDCWCDKSNTSRFQTPASLPSRGIK